MTHRADAITILCRPALACRGPRGKSPVSDIQIGHEISDPLCHDDIIAPEPVGAYPTVPEAVTSVLATLPSRG